MTRVQLYLFYLWIFWISCVAPSRRRIAGVVVHAQPEEGEQVSSLFDDNNISSNDTTMATTTTTDETMCTICLDGSEPMGEFAPGDSCVEYEAMIHNFPVDSGTCIESRMQGFLYCSCPTYPMESFCTMCDDGHSSLSKDMNLNRWIPFVDMYCTDARFQLNTNEDNMCDEIKRADYFCSCPGSVRSDCYLCGDGNGVDGSTLSSLAVPMEHKQRLIPPRFQYSCQDYDDAASLFTTETDVDDKNHCDQLIGEDIPVDVKSYCGCPQQTANLQSPSSAGNCDLCGIYELVNDSKLVPVHPVSEADYGVASLYNGGGGRRARSRRRHGRGATVSDDKPYGSLTCSDVNYLTAFITDEDYCKQIKSDVMPRCCVGAPSATPTASRPSTDMTPSTRRPTALDDGRDDYNDSNDTEDVNSVLDSTSSATTNANAASLLLAILLLCFTTAIKLFMLA